MGVQFAVSVVALFLARAALAQLSCSSDASGSASCEYEPTGSGLLLHTQFWDSDTGPANSWTIHGLWPDSCSGGYTENCDSSRAYTNITSILDEFGEASLVTYMNQYWISNDESASAFWAHEWSTHGTCVSTLRPTCYSNYQTGQEAADFFQIVVNLFKTRDTYQALSEAGIVPSSSKTYTSKAMIAALTKLHGAAPILLCEDNALYEIYYAFHADGSVKAQDFVATTATKSKTTCPTTGIQYLPKSETKSAKVDL